MWVFGDSFDLYATISDLQTGYWDSGTTSTFSLTAGRFPDSQALTVNGANTSALKTSGSNDAIHHITVSYLQVNPFSSTDGMYFTLLDGATAQCTVKFQLDGKIVLQSGAVNGTALATFPGIVTLQNQWYAFEIEIVINNTTGSIRGRVNNAMSDTFALVNIDTQASANAYANALKLGVYGNGVAKMDDFLWRAHPLAVPWVGDIRCYTQMPTSDVSKQFTPLTGTSNFAMVNEPQEDKATTYVYSSTVNNADFYGIAPLGLTPAQIVAVTARAFAQKSDAGSRSGAVQLKSGGTTAQGANGHTLTAGTWAWMWDTYNNDPNTGAAWTTAAVNSLQIGPILLS